MGLLPALSRANRKKVLPSPLIYPAQKKGWPCTNVKRHKLILCYVRTVTRGRSTQTFALYRPPLYLKPKPPLLKEKPTNVCESGLVSPGVEQSCRLHLNIPCKSSFINGNTQRRFAHAQFPSWSPACPAARPRVHGWAEVFHAALRHLVVILADEQLASMRNGDARACYRILLHWDRLLSNHWIAIWYMYWCDCGKENSKHSHACRTEPLRWTSNLSLQ